MKIELWGYSSEGERVFQFRGEWSGSLRLVRGIFSREDVEWVSLFLSRGMTARCYHISRDGSIECC